MGKGCTIVWFRRDLRIEDNRALIEAARLGGVLAVYIWCPAEEGHFYPGRVSRWWLKNSLCHLQRSLRSLGCTLLLMKSPDSLSALLRCAAAANATRVFFNHLYDPVSVVRDHKVKQRLLELGFIVQSFNGDLLYEPWNVYDENGYAFTNFEIYWRKCLSMPLEPEAPLLPPRRLMSPSVDVFLSLTAEELGLEHETEKSSNALLGRGWSPGWSNADRVLDEFLDGSLLEYGKHRQKVDCPKTSLLSPYIHFGELSVRKIFHCVRRKQILWAKEGNVEGEASVDLFLRSIGLREYSRYVSFNFPFTHEKSLLYSLKFFPWRNDESYFKAWRQGRTGYPLVDAGMRELWATGWMHNRIRVVTSSFCVKFLQLPWTWGMKYFWDTLLDADIECDVLGWQYISGGLPDGHELDRMDCPKAQGLKFDPDGEYVRQWLPELARMPNEWIHQPWSAPIPILKAAGVELGTNYPRPIVEMDSARERLQNAIKHMWELDSSARISCIEDVGDTFEVHGTGGLSHEKMRVPRVAVKRSEHSSISSYQDQRVPNFIQQESSSPQCNLEENSHASDEEAEKFPCAMSRDVLDKEICSPIRNLQYFGSKRRNIQSDDSDVESTAESSSTRKRNNKGSSTSFETLLPFDRE
eukprot:TRINITY_DN4238_c0_g3_i1.p1 TRINITY_DN4238_c0_g3~~TRINITY_DN4238_c0_g3_i1.p1  ORF type:complete len:638 (-),score=115.05 TRINITY_DN4238_c0_g3_i1:235-2148(-)